MTRLKLMCAGLVQTECGQIQSDGYTNELQVVWH